MFKPKSQKMFCNVKTLYFFSLHSLIFDTLHVTEAVLSMLEHPLRIVNDLINHDDHDDNSGTDGNRSHDQDSATPPPSSSEDSAGTGGGGGDTPTLECATSNSCSGGNGGGGGEGVKVDSSPNQDDLVPTTPLENSK